MSGQEARFLEAHQARINASTTQRLKRTSRHEQQTAKDFWTSLRQDLRTWDSCLCNLQHDKSATSQVQSQELDVLLQELYALKTKSLSSNDVMELPAADVRLLHEEFTTRATQLQHVREQLIPIQKFTFKRYRAAMKEQLQQQKEKTGLNGTQEKPVPPPMLPTMHCTTLAGNVIENYKNATIVMNPNGTLVIHDKDTEKEHTIQQDEANENASSLLVQNVQHCHVTIHGNFKALHIQNVSFSTIHVVHAIEGALHVTTCHDVELEACSHQLRIHTSTALKIHAKVQSGPILEDCHDVTFYATCKDDVVYDTKDFCWLRNGVPSPNFCITLEEKEQNSGNGGSANDSQVRNVQQDRVDNAENVSLTTKDESPDEQATVLANENINTVSMEEEDSDEEDEL